jgi:hypothetical protein
MLFFSEQTNRGCYTSQSKQTGDTILLRAYKRGMLYFSEENKRECYTSESIQMGDTIFLRAKQTGDAMLLRTYMFALRSIASPVCLL